MITRSSRNRAPGYGILVAMSRQVRRPYPRESVALRLAAVLASGVLVLSGCVNGGDSESGSSSAPASSSAPPSGGTQGTPTPDGQAGKPIQTRWIGSASRAPIRLDLLALGHVTDKVLKLRLRFTNIGPGRRQIEGMFGDKVRASLGGIVVVDGKNLKKYYPEHGTDHHCICTNYHGPIIEPGQSFDSTILYPTPPKDVEKVNVVSSLTPAFIDVPIAQAVSKSPGDPDPKQVSMLPPKIESVTSVTEDLNGDKAVDERNDHVDVRLSSDVLFALNKASLSAKAKAILKDVAGRIDDAKGNTVEIDGYTDNTGNDSINVPLSKRRATSVKKALRKLVDRSGITYQSAGHGSEDPVASNKSASGRSKNRRVTVSFAK